MLGDVMCGYVVRCGGMRCGVWRVSWFTSISLVSNESSQIILLAMVRVMD